MIVVLILMAAGVLVVGDLLQHEEGEVSFNVRET